MTGGAGDRLVAGRVSKHEPFSHHLSWQFSFAAPLQTTVQTRRRVMTLRLDSKAGCNNARAGPRSTVHAGVATPKEPQTQTHTGHSDNGRLAFVLTHVLPNQDLDVRQRER